MKDKFYKLPKVFFEEEQYKSLSALAKLLYALLWDRSRLSVKNGFTDNSDKAMVYFTNCDVCKKLGCNHDKATRLFRELERFNLIKRQKQGKGKPDFIYVEKYVESDVENYSQSEIVAFSNSENKDSKVLNLSVLDCDKSARNKTNINKTDISKINLSISYEDAEEKIKDQIEYNVLKERDYESLDEIVSLLSDTYSMEANYVIFGKHKVAIQTFRNRIYMLTAEHIEYVIRCLRHNSTEIKNIRAYMLTTLYNSVDTYISEECYA